MSRIALNNKGLTLLEIIISLVLVGIVAALVGVSSYYLVDGFLFSRKNVDTLLKGQTAMARIQKELNNIKIIHTNPADTSETKIKFTSYKDDAPHTISWGGSGTNLLLDGDVLTDHVTSFSIAYYENYTGSGSVVPTGSGSTIPTGFIIEVNLVLTGADNVPSAFTARIAPSFPATTTGL